MKYINTFDKNYSIRIAWEEEAIWFKCNSRDDLYGYDDVYMTFESANKYMRGKNTTHVRDQIVEILMIRYPEILL